MTNLNDLFESSSNIFSSENLYPRHLITNKNHEYILITSLNLGGAEKIVTDQLWANYWGKDPIRYTLIVLYEKEKEHPVPPNTLIVRLKGQLEHGKSLFEQIAYEDKRLVAHLINDTVLNYLFSLNVKVNLVIHNDQQGWVNKPYIFNHPNIGAIVGVCRYVEKQIRQYTDKPVLSVRHQINYKNSLFNEELRSSYRHEFNFKASDKVIGMIGRIAWQKNYGKAIETLHFLRQKDESWKLVIVGGFEPNQQNQYLYLIQLINHFRLQEHVILTGFRNDAKEIMNSFDFALNTSHYEGLSMATQELLGNGLTVFCANVCGQGEIIDQKNQIVFYPISKNPETIAQIIYQKTSNGASRANYSEEEIQSVSKRVWASHRIWNLLQHAGHQEQENDSFAFLTSNLNIGGAQKSLFNLAKELKNNDIDSPIIVANQSNHFHLYNELTQNGNEVYLAHESKDAFDITNSIFNYLKAKKITTLLLWNVDSKLRLLLTKIGEGWLRVIDVSPGHYCFEEMLLDKSFMDGIYFNEIDYHDKLHKIVFKYQVANDRNPFYNLTKNKIHFIPNGVNFESNLITKNDLELINRINSKKKDNDYNFVVCGRISPTKHLEIIIEAFNQLDKDNLSLFIVGNVEPEYREYFDKLKDKFDYLFENKVFLMGSCDNSQTILPLFDSIVVLGTHQGCPNIVLEAMSSEVLVIANDSGGTRELVMNETGLLLDEIPNIEKTKDAMIYSIENQDKMKEKRLYAKKFIQSKFSMELMMSNYLKIIKK